MSISLTPDQERFIQTKLQAGKYRSAQEVLEIALRLLDEYDLAEAEWVEDVREKIDAAIPRFGSAKGLVRMSDDFDAPVADFEEYAP
jgi:antitoxin ParD1/3/4